EIDRVERDDEGDGVLAPAEKVIGGVERGSAALAQRQRGSIAGEPVLVDPDMVRLRGDGSAAVTDLVEQAHGRTRQITVSRSVRSSSSRLVGTTWLAIRASPRSGR